MTIERQTAPAEPDERPGDGPDERTGAVGGGAAPSGPGHPGRTPLLVRLVRHEWTLAVLGGLLLAVVLTWPTLRDITSTIPQDIGDPTLQAWQIAWGGHAVLHDPTQLWHSNTFYPEPYTYAYSDTLLGYAPAGMIGEGPVAGVVRYNILYVLVHALAFVGAYALVRQLGGGRIGAAAAGVAFGYAPWKLAQAGHLHVLSIGGIALALAMLARGHGWSLRHGYRPDRARPGWAFAGWLVAAWQVTLGFGIGLPFVYVLALVCLAAGVGFGWSWWRRRSRPPFGRRLLLADLAGGVAFAAVGIFMALPYLEVVARHPAGRRTLAHVQMFSPPWRGFLTAPPENWLWGERHATARGSLSFAGEMTLLPGVVLIGLAFAGLFFSVWRLRHRVLLAAGVLVSVGLASGTTLGGDGNPGYATLVLHAPGFDAIRTSGRLVLWTTLLLGILAAGALTALTRFPVGEPSDDRARPSDDRTGPAGDPSRPLTEPSDAAPPTVPSGDTASSGGAAQSGGAASSAADVPAEQTPTLTATTAPTLAPTPTATARVESEQGAQAPAGVGERPGMPVLRTAAYQPPPGAEEAERRVSGGRTARFRRLVVRLIALVPLALIVLEGVNTTPHAPVLPQPVALRDAEGPLLVLPSNGTLEFSIMLWSTDGFPKIVNGLAAFTPESQAQTLGVTANFPDQFSVDHLRRLGVRTVVVLPEYLPGTPWQDVLSRPVDGLGVVREEVAGSVVYRLG
ncbi:hypothetical protein [Plantactinospora endophytica]|uniref:Glycosyltransferase RgtA/B/C/D-like domain-containing protein n=1 Tax=Plantactinospora endophytica TaxID=673535 RepID=A0ABQ4E6F9_9ACTN|nr:hypothetical protein [Plantactinospora endophytica]GIG90299.1 hypothetical protein Pen02_52350 [Plantactinospora endophytica]